ncbi:MAG: hypothetical protein IPF73_09930 [Betaproteobacteria bacterium]|nr:hypothetical protein [Betaproteobacteria bacterium]
MGRSRMGRGLLLAAALCASPIALADTLSLLNTVNLPAQFSASENLHPPGLGVDEGASELLFAQQCNHPIYRTDLDGNLLGSVAVDQNTSRASRPTRRTTTSPTTRANSAKSILGLMPKAGPPSAAFSAETAAYGGYPIDLRGGQIYRTEPSSNYDWSDLNQVRVANVATPDTITSTISLRASGMGDFAVDLDGGNLWVLEWSGGRILRYDLQNGGAPLDSFSLGLEGQTAGLTYFNGRLYYYDWVASSGSTLRIYDIARVAGPARVTAVPVPAASTWSLAAAALLLGFVALRRMRARPR